MKLSDVKTRAREFMERSTLTVAKAAQYIGVSQDTMYTMVRENKIPNARARRRILFRKSTLDDWMAEQEGYETNLAQVIQMERRG